MLKVLLNKPTMSSMLGGKQAHLATHLASWVHDTAALVSAWLWVEESDQCPLTYTFNLFYGSFIIMTLPSVQYAAPNLPVQAYINLFEASFPGAINSGSTYLVGLYGLLCLAACLSD